MAQSYPQFSFERAFTGQPVVMNFIIAAEVGFFNAAFAVTDFTVFVRLFHVRRRLPLGDSSGYSSSFCGAYVRTRGPFRTFHQFHIHSPEACE